MIRFIITLVLAYLAYRLIRNLFKPSRKIDAKTSGRVIDEMVQDPVCKTYIPRQEAIKKRIEGKDHFFCSEECASKFQESPE